MTRLLACPDRERLRLLMGNLLPGEEHDVLVKHLTTCQDCRAVVDGMTDLSPPTARVKSYDLRVEPSPSDSVSEHMTHTPPSRPAGPVVLDFLTPSLAAESLGRLGQFEVLEVIGRGGMGLVLKAFDPVLERTVAIKVLDPHLSADDTSRQRFCREARAAAAITHENVIAVHQVDLDESGTLPLMVMQLVTGETLQARLDRVGALPVKEILQIGVQATAGLAAAHAQGLIHRDIKPDNILLEAGTDRVKLTDFGLALGPEDVRLTQTGMVAGTPLYMSPEQARGEPIDGRADLFSLGSVLYAMCTGKPPFQGSTPYMVLRQITEEQSRPVREVNPSVPEWLAAVIDKLHAKSPADRYQSAAELAEVLGQQLALLTPPGQSPIAIVPVPRPLAPRRLVWRWVGVVGLAAALLIAGSLGAHALVTGWWRLAESPEAALAVALSPDGTESATAREDGSVGFGDPATGRATLLLKAHEGRVWALAYAPHGRTLATYGADGVLKLWDARTKKEMNSWADVGNVRSLTFSQDGRGLLLGRADGTVQLWELPAE